jgi:uncharacterized protein
MRIGVDIDEVLAPLLPGFLTRYNERHGTAFRAEQFDTYRLERVMGIPFEETVEEVRAFYRESLAGILPFPEAFRALQELKEEGHELFAVTGRHGEGILVTEAWLERHFPALFSGIRFAGHRGLNAEASSKAAICKELGISVLVEDDPHYVEECRAERIHLLLFDRPWNKSQPTAEGVMRIHSWHEVLDAVEMLETGLPSFGGKIE